MCEVKSETAVEFIVVDPTCFELGGIAGGDDYELVFTAPPGVRLPDVGVLLTRVGRIEAEPGLRVVDARGEAVAHGLRSFDHFAS
ncbi:MAG: hypothetical protein IIA03_13710 [Proteobacteria bacterium]|nr:hypothetical protein [Pseudomonadota bacterium]